MTKKELAGWVLKNGKPLNPRLWKWNKKTNTLSTDEYGIVFNFSVLVNCTFKTGDACTFRTGYACTFRTGYGCTFQTGDDCTFQTRDACTFNTGYGCTFNTGYGCTFNTGDGCTFKTGNGCTFQTGYGCTFQTGDDCAYQISKINYPYPPLWFNGSRYPIGFMRPGIIKSGCIERPLEWWQSQVVSCAKQNSYSDEQIKEYKNYVVLLASWAKSFGWEKELPEVR